MQAETKSGGKPKDALDVQRRILSTALRGLAYLHSHRIVHRDLCPQNILLSQAGDAVIADFESSKDRDLEVSVALHSTVVAMAR